MRGEYICTYSSVRQATRETGVSRGSINKVANEKQKHGGGYIWRFDNPTQQLSREILAKYSNPTQVQINQYDTNGVLIGKFINVNRIAK